MDITQNMINVYPNVVMESKLKLKIVKMVMFYQVMDVTRSVKSNQITGVKYKTNNLSVMKNRSLKYLLIKFKNFQIITIKCK